MGFFVYMIWVCCLWLQFWPIVGSPRDGALDEHGGSIAGGAVAVTDEDVFAVEGVGCTVTGCFPFFLVAFQEEGATTVDHILAVAVEVGTVDGLAATYCHTVVALCSTTTVVPRNEKIVIAAVLEDEGGFDGVRACETRGGVLFGRFEIGVVTSGYGAWLFTFGYVHGGVESGYLYAVPERSPYHPGGVCRIVDGEVGVDGVPVVALLARGHDATFVLPKVCAERATAEETDGRAILSEGGAAVGQPPATVPFDDVGCPDVIAESWH